MFTGDPCAVIMKAALAAEPPHGRINDPLLLNGFVALTYAVSRNMTETAKVLLDHGHAQVNTIDERGRAALHHALERGMVSFAVHLIEHAKADVNQRTTSGTAQFPNHYPGRTALMLAASKPQVVPLVTLLLEKGADVRASTQASASSKDNYTALTIAVMHDIPVDTTTRLLESKHGAVVSTRDIEVKHLL